MKKIVFLFLLLQTLLFGCATCALMIPSVEVDIDVKMQEKSLEKSLEKISFAWRFSDIYTSEVTTQFDKNKNEKLDKDELQKMQKAMLEYLQPKNMLTHLQYADENATEPSSLKPKYDNFRLELVDDLLLFTYDATLQKEISPNALLSVAFEDDESFFVFIMSQLHINQGDFSYTKNLYLFTASIAFMPKTAMSDVLQEEAPNAAQTPLTNENSKLSPKPMQESLLQEYLAKIKTLFRSIKDEKNPLSYLFLLFFAYLYGVVHAMGPGHGKTLVASYFLANERSYAKALIISLSIAFVHTFSAFILTLIIYFILSTFLAQFLDDTIFYTTKISALIIISIALYLLYKKYQFYKTTQAPNKTMRFTLMPNTSHIQSCACSSCKIDKNSTDFALIISAGIIPCPGTTTIFIFALSLELYYAGFIAALIMSLGMSTIIFVSALLSTIVRKKVLKEEQRVKKYLEFISLMLILALGGVLLLY